MNTLTLADIETIVDTMVSVALAHEDEFSQLDGLCGDGDFGASLATGFDAIRTQWAELDRTSISAFALKCSTIITSKTGGCSGPLWGTAFMRFGIGARGRESLSLADLVALSQAAQAGMMARGGAKLGDKTLLDAMDAATTAIQQTADADGSIPRAFAAAARASAAATETAKSWTARRGRQSFTGNRSRDTYDPGMVAVTKMLEAVSTCFPIST